MAAAGTLSRPTSAQGNYSINAFQTYYAPPSPTVTHGAYARPASAGANIAPDSYSTYRKPVSSRPSVFRHSSSIQYMAPSQPNAPTRIYGSRNGSLSADDLGQNSRPIAPGHLQRTHTAPEFNDPVESGPVLYDKGSVSSGEPGAFGASRIDRRVPVPASSPVLRSREMANVSDHAEPRAGFGKEDFNSEAHHARNMSDSSSSAIEPRNAAKPLSRETLQTSGNLNDSDVIVASSRSALDRQHDSRLDATEDTVISDVPSSSTVDTYKASQTINRNQEMQGTTRPDSAQSPIEPASEDLKDTRQSGYARNSPRSQTPVPSNYISEEKSKSLKSRLRRALSFSSATNLSELADGETRRSTTPLPQTARSDANLYGQKNKSTDNVSISSTASSASVMLRKIGHGLSKKTKRSLGGIFSGSNSRAKERVNTGDPAVFENTLTPTVGAVSYVNAEVDMNDRPLSPQREIFSNHSRAHGSISSIQTLPTPPTVEITKAADNVNGHGSVAFPRLSQEISSEDDRSRRASMHLERPLPIDLAAKDEKSYSIRKSPWRSRMDGTNQKGTHLGPSIALSTSSEPGRRTFSGKGILKKSVDPLNLDVPQVAHNALPPLPSNQEPETKTTNAFDFSFKPVTEIEEFSVALEDPTMSPAATHVDSTTPQASRLVVPATSPSSTILKFSPRITIHDTYTANEYDRRGEVATCNRLTPLLAQRIKEELNAYKMDEMDVATESKMYTHFFS